MKRPLLYFFALLLYFPCPPLQAQIKQPQSGPPKKEFATALEYDRYMVLQVNNVLDAFGALDSSIWHGSGQMIKVIRAYQVFKSVAANSLSEVQALDNYKGEKDLRIATLNYIGLFKSAGDNNLKQITDNLQKENRGPEDNTFIKKAYDSLLKVESLQREVFTYARARFADKFPFEMQEPLSYDNPLDYDGYIQQQMLYASLAFARMNVKFRQGDKKASTEAYLDYLKQINLSLANILALVPYEADTLYRPAAIAYLQYYQRINEKEMKEMVQNFLKKGKALNKDPRFDSLARQEQKYRIAFRQAHDDFASAHKLEEAIFCRDMQSMLRHLQKGLKELEGEPLPNDSDTYLASELIEGSQSGRIYTENGKRRVEYLMQARGAKGNETYRQLQERLKKCVPGKVVLKADSDRPTRDAFAKVYKWVDKGNDTVKPNTYTIILTTYDSGKVSLVFEAAN